jgi:hypothetical protein
MDIVIESSGQINGYVLALVVCSQTKEMTTIMEVEGEYAIKQLQHEMKLISLWNQKEHTLFNFHI